MEAPDRPASRRVPVLAALSADLLDPPDLTAHGWTEVVNEVVVRFKNRDRNWQTDAMSWRNPAAFNVTGRPLTQALECDWITDPAVAWKVAIAYGKSHSLPWLEGRLRARRADAYGRETLWF